MIHECGYRLKPKNNHFAKAQVLFASEIDTRRINEVDDCPAYDKVPSKRFLIGIRLSAHGQAKCGKNTAAHPLHARPVHDRSTSL
jgi:hypothetical protein